MKGLLESLAGLRILVVGDLMLDQYTWGDASRISPEAPVPVVDVSKETQVAGGAANVALNLRSLGAKAEVCGWIGRDTAGDTLRGLLEAKGIGLNEAFHSGDLTTIVKTRVMVRNQQLCRLDREDSPSRYAFGPDEIKRVVDCATSVDAVILSDYGKGSLSTELISALNNSGVLLAMDPKPRRPVSHRGLDLLTPNRNEALQMAGVKVNRNEAFPAEEVCRRIYESHMPKNLVITLGAHGMLVCESGEVSLRIPTMDREVFDVSGAGDTVIAVLTLARAAGIEIERAARLANLAAGIVVGKVGTATVLPEELVTLGEVL